MLKYLAVLIDQFASLSCATKTLPGSYKPPILPPPAASSYEATSSLRPSVEDAGKAAVILEDRNRRLETQVDTLQEKAAKATIAARHAQAELKQLADAKAGATPDQLNALLKHDAHRVTISEQMEAELATARDDLKEQKVTIEELGKNLASSVRLLSLAELAARDKDTEAKRLLDLASEEIAKNVAQDQEKRAIAKERDTAVSASDKARGELKIFRVMFYGAAALLVVAILLYVLKPAALR